MQLERIVELTGGIRRQLLCQRVRQSAHGCCVGRFLDRQYHGSRSSAYIPQSGAYACLAQNRLNDVDSEGR